MSNPNLVLAHLAVAAAALCGCAVKPVVTQVGPDTEAHAREILVEKVDLAVKAQRDLAVTAAESKDAVERKQALLEVDEVDIDYIGQAQPLLESIAYRYGYRYVETGKRSDLRQINIRVSHESVVEVLRDVSYQIEAGADLVLDKDASPKTMRLVYKKS